MNDTKGPYSGAAGPGNASSTVGYCQECGQALTAGTVLRVADGVFCQPCAVQRQGGGWQAVPPPSYTGAANGNRAPSRGAGLSGVPSPRLAGVLGFIPGVGAMYNGQYAKGALHLVVFVVLLSAADHVNWVFYWLVWGWIFYQAFDAYHTAAARRDGLPLPNPFGWNDIGDRFGVPRTPDPAGAPGGPGRPAGAPVGSAPSSAAFRTPPPPAEGFGPFQPPTASAVAEERSEARAGENETFAPRSIYERPEEYASENPYAEEVSSAFFGPNVSPGASYMKGVPFNPTYTGSSDPGPVSAAMPSTQKRFPVGALWLIGLGLVFLLGNVLPGLRLNGRWLVPLVLAAMACWSGVRRWEQYRVALELEASAAPNLAHGLTGPSVLLTLAVLLSLDAANVSPIGHSWPLLLMVWGIMLLAKRATSFVAGSVSQAPAGSDSRMPQGTPGMPPQGL